MTDIDEDFGTIPGMRIAGITEDEDAAIQKGLELFHLWFLSVPRSAWTAGLFSAAEKVKDLVLAGFVHPDFFEDRIFLAALRSDNLKEQISALRRQALANRKAFRAKHPDEEAPFTDFRFPIDKLP